MGCSSRKPAEHAAEDTENLGLWSERVRSAVIDAEVVSRIAFTGTPKPGAVAVWHFAPETEATADAAPVGAYHPIVRLERPSMETFQAQLRYLDSYSELRPDRSTEILETLASPVPLLASVGFLRADRHKWTLEYLGVALRLARHVVYRVKHGLACRRPIEFSPQVQPMIQTPGHGALPSGHATESFMLAHVLGQVMEAGEQEQYANASYRTQLMRIAARITLNRTVAGVHFPADSIAGAMLGLTLADYLIARTRTGSYSAAHFHGNAESMGGTDFLWSDIYDVEGKRLRHGDIIRPFGGEDPIALNGEAEQAGNASLRWLWDRAVKEWR
mgnify:FL=1